STRAPPSAKAAATLRTVVVLATPPFWLATVITRTMLLAPFRIRRPSCPGDPLPGISPSTPSACESWDPFGTLFSSRRLRASQPASPAPERISSGDGPPGLNYAGDKPAHLWAGLASFAPFMLPGSMHRFRRR